jgi:hypothetical protein
MSLKSRRPLVAPAGGGLDQSTTSGKQRQTVYVGGDSMNGGRGVVFPEAVGHEVPMPYTSAHDQLSSGV